MAKQTNRAELLQKYTKRRLFYIVHLKNLRSIVDKGIFSHQRMRELGISHRDISNKNVNSLRSQKTEPIFEQSIHHYVPLYFRANNPMLYARKGIQDQLAVLYVDPSIVDYTQACLFTDGNAASRRTEFYSDFSALHRLDWDILNEDRWTKFDNFFWEKKRKRCAEVLIPIHVPFRYVTAIAVKKREATDQVKAAIKHLTNSPKVRSRPNWFVRSSD